MSHAAGSTSHKKDRGLLPEQADSSYFHRILDVGCASGGWALELAFALPETEVVGLDISERMIGYARDQAQVQELENKHFHVMDATKPLAFPDASFDLINTRMVAGFMPRSVWPMFIGECWRILRPGGVIRLTECDSWGITNSAAFERLHALALLAMHHAGLGFSPNGSTLAITAMLGRLLRDAGFKALKLFKKGPLPIINFSRYEEGAQGMLALRQIAGNGERRSRSREHFHLLCRIATFGLPYSFGKSR